MALIDGRHTTNYTDTLILPAADCRAPAATVPAKPDSIAGLQYDLLTTAPYALTSDDLLCAVTARRKGVRDDATLRAALFSKGQPCLRASPLAKTHGWAFHHDAEGRVALVDPDSARGRDLAADPATAKVAAMRNARA